MKTTKSAKRSNTKITKAEKAAQLPLPGFRVVIRGIFGKGKQAKRVRRVHTVHAADAGVAAELAGKNAALLKGLDLGSIYMTVLEPLSEVRAARKAA